MGLGVDDPFGLAQRAHVALKSNGILEVGPRAGQAQFAVAEGAYQAAEEERGEATE